MREIRVAVIGTKFMGRAHACRQARAFFAQPIVPLLYLACGTNPRETKERESRHWEKVPA